MKIIYTTTLLILLNFDIGAQTQLSLHQAFSLLESQNEDIKQAQINIRISKIDLKDSKNAFYPRLSFSTGHQYNLGLAFDQIAGQLVTGNEWSNTAYANLGVNATIFQGMSRIGQIKNTLLALESKEIQLSQLRQSLRLEVLTRYFEILTNTALYNTSLKQLDFANKQLIQEIEKLEVGTNTLVDVTQAESQVAQQKLNIEIAKDALMKSEINLKQVLTIPLKDSILLVDQEVPNTPINKLYDYELEKDPAVLQAELGNQQSELTLKYAKSPYFPTISISSGYGTNYSSERRDYITGEYMPFGNQVNQNRSLNIGLSLSMSIFDGFKTKNNIRKLRLDVENKRSIVTKTKAEREKIYQLALQEYKRSLSEKQLYLIQNKALKSNYEAIKERYDLGVTTAMEYNKALLDLNISELNLIKASYTQRFNQLVLIILTDNGL